MKRIYVPYEAFVIFLAVVHLLCGRSILNWNWLLLALGLQGSAVGVLGAEQTWFITPLLLCYLLTPLFRRLAAWADGTKRTLFVVLAAFFLPLIWDMLPPAFFGTILSQLSWYAIAYFYGWNFSKISRTVQRAWLAFALMCVSFGLRVLVRFLADGTILYDRIIAGYTHAIAAFCIFYIFSVVFERIRPLTPIAFISGISFEIYLYHYMFTVGPVSLFGTTGIWVLDCVLVTAVTFVIAIAMSKLSMMILKKLR